jgi:hypothetical protein
VPKAKTGNFTLRTIVKGCPAEKAAHRYLSLQRSGQYSELRMIQRGKSKIDIVGYKWPDKGVRRRLGIGKGQKNPFIQKLDWASSTAADRMIALARAAHDQVSLDIVDGSDHVLLSPDSVRRLHYLFQYEMSIADAHRRFDQSFVVWYRAAARSIAMRDRKKNPNQKGATTPNQVKFGMRGHTKVGWINRETLTRYQISYKVGSALRHVWRMKDKVKFARTGKPGRVPNNCPKTANPPEVDIHAASEMFHQRAPRFKSFKEDFTWPKKLPLIGPCTMIEYVSDKFDGRVRRYYHKFGKGTRVYFDPAHQKNGEAILIIRGPFEIKPEGITG